MAQLIEGLGPQVEGLQDCLSLVLKTLPPPGASPEDEVQRSLRAALLPMMVTKIRVREAGAFLQLMGLPLAGAHVNVPRILPNRERVQAMAQAADLLLLLVNNLLPPLRRHPTDAKLLRVVNASATKLREYGRHGGGSFHPACTRLSTIIELYATDATAFPLYAPYAPLKHRIEVLDASSRDFLDAVFTLRHPSSAEAEVLAEAVQAAAWEAQALAEAVQAAQAAGGGI